VLAFSSPHAQADIKAQTNVGMNILQLHRDLPNMKNIPVPKVHDTTFVFSDGD
jgi:hypothetical protein